MLFIGCKKAYSFGWCCFIIYAIKGAKMKIIKLPLLFAFALWANFAIADEIKTVSPESVGLSTPRLEKISSFMQSYIDQKKMAGPRAGV
jgi:hypothetical protein